MSLVRKALGLDDKIGCEWTVFVDGQRHLAVPDASAMLYLMQREGVVSLART